MPFFRRKKQQEYVGLEEEECNLRDMFGEPPGALEASVDNAPASTISSDFSPTSDGGSSSSHSDDDSGDSSSREEESNEPQENAEAQEVMNDNLELMREVVLKIREDDEFARNIYANCPRLQLLLNDHPDLKPLFEDPKFVVLNFEKVYRDAGGTLPGDEAEKPSKIQKIKNIIVAITSHPLFKVFKILMVIKKIVFFFSPTKFIGILKSCLWPSLDDIELDADGLDPEDGDYEAQKTKLSLNQAADRLEDPEIQEQMQEAMDDPDKMEDLIENNKELRELRDSNPVCAEMMNDPETLKIISDPENLRALSECPDLIAEDFANPDMLLDALEDVDVDADVDADIDGDVDAEGEYDQDDGDFSEEEYSSGEEYSSDEYSDEDEEAEEEKEEEEEEEEDDGLLDDVEIERDDDRDERSRERSRSRSRGKARSVGNQEQERDAEKDGEDGGGRFGFLSTVAEAGLGVMGGGIFEGDGFDIFGGGDEMEGLEGAEDLGGGAEEGFALEDIEEVEEDPDILEKVEEIEDSDVVGQVEDGLEDLEEVEKESEEDKGLLEKAEELEDNELLGQVEDGLEDVEATDERERDDSTVHTDAVSEDQGIFATMEEIDEGAAGQGADLADELDAEDRDKDEEREEREAGERAARGGGGGFYGAYEDDGDGGGDEFASGFKGEDDDDDDDWIRY